MVYRYLASSKFMPITLTVNALLANSVLCYLYRQIPLLGFSTFGTHVTTKFHYFQNSTLHPKYILYLQIPIRANYKTTDLQLNSSTCKFHYLQIHNTINRSYNPCLLVKFLWTSDQSFLANVNSSSCSLYVVVRPSVVCRLSSVVCLSSVCIVRAPYSDDWNFRQCFYAIGYLGHLLTSR